MMMMHIFPYAGQSRRVTQNVLNMLSGHEDSDAALRHAAELLEEAAMAQSQA